MKIVVAYKWAPNPQDASVSPDGVIDWSRAKASVSEYDSVAIELGRRLADATGAELIGVSIGPKETGSPMARKAPLSRGLDRLVLVADDELADADSVTTGLTLAEVVRGIGDVDLVLAGDSSVDVGARIVPAVVAGALGWPCFSQVSKVSGTSGALSIERNYLGGSQELIATGSVVLSAAVDAVVPRVPGMKDILASGKKPSEELALASLAVSKTPVISVTGRNSPELKAREGNLVDGVDPAAAAVAVVSALKASNII